jgi:hypothetical protein
MLDHFGAGDAALALLIGQLIYLVQLAHHALLLGRWKAAEVGVAAQHPLLLLSGKIAVLVEPFAQMAGRALNMGGITGISGPGIAGAGKGRTGVAGVGGRIAVLGLARGIGSRPFLIPRAGGPCAGL